MTEKVCQFYEEEQVGKVREGRKAVLSGKMPDLGWDIAETQLQKDYKQRKVQENSENYNLHTTLPLQTMITIAILITTILENIIAYAQEIPKAMRKAAQAIKTTTTKIGHNKLFQNIKKSYKTAALAVKIETSTMDRTSRMNQPTQPIETLKNLQARKISTTSMTDHTSHTHQGPTTIFTTSMTSCKTVSDILYKD